MKTSKESTGQVGVLKLLNLSLSYGIGVGVRGFYQQSYGFDGVDYFL